MSPLFAESSNLPKFNPFSTMETSAVNGSNIVDDENYSQFDDYTPSSSQLDSYTPGYYPTSSLHSLPPYNLSDVRPSSFHYTPNDSQFRVLSPNVRPDNIPSSSRYNSACSQFEFGLSSPYYNSRPPVNHQPSLFSPEPDYTPTSPQYTPTSPLYNTPTSSSYHPYSPEYSPTSPHYDPAPWQFSPYQLSPPVYTPTSPQYHPTSSPGYTPLSSPSPSYNPTPLQQHTHPFVHTTSSSSPTYTSSSPAYRPAPIQPDVHPFVHTDVGSDTTQRSNDIVIDDKYNSAEPFSPSEAAVFDCNICLGMAKDPVVTLCGHLFCWPCLHKWLNYHCVNKECPVCKGKVSEDMVIPIFGKGFSDTEIQKKGPSRLKVPPRPRGLRIKS